MAGKGGRNPNYMRYSVGVRVNKAVGKVIDDGWPIAEAARQFGINRGNLSKRVKAEREAREEKYTQSRAEVLAEAGSKLVLPHETRRVPETYRDFFNTYFTNWVCPSCDEHHEVPDFHDEMVKVQRSGSKRNVILLPPYHSKSTVLTVMDTVMDIAHDPNLRTAIVSKGQDLAKGFLRQIKLMLVDERLYDDSVRNLIEDYGPFVGDTWSKEEIIVAGRTGGEAGATVQALGYGGAVYGRRIDRIKFDDIADLENQRNPDRVLQMLEKIDKEYLSRIGKRGIATWVGTRVNAGDLYPVLMKRPGYKVVRYPMILSDEDKLTIWPEHADYDYALQIRNELSPHDFQLIYQQVDMPGAWAAFTEQIIENAKNGERTVGQYDNRWRLVAGLDPGGATKTSGYTAFALVGVNTETHVRYIIDSYAQKGMQPGALRDKIMEWSDLYPIYEWRIESVGVQSQIAQSPEITRPLAQRGIRVMPHQTSGNKWDREFGVEAMAPKFSAGLYDIPWLGVRSAQVMHPLIEQLLGFPMAAVQDRVMALWFAECGIREILQRTHLPMFDSRVKLPSRIQRNRRIVSFSRGEIRPVRQTDLYRGHLTEQGSGQLRATYGAPADHHLFEQPQPPQPPERPVNVNYDEVWGESEPDFGR